MSVVSGTVGNNPSIIVCWLCERRNMCVHWTNRFFSAVVFSSSSLFWATPWWHYNFKTIPRLSFCTLKISRASQLLLAPSYPPKYSTLWPHFFVSIKSIVLFLASLLPSLPRPHVKSFLKIHSQSPPNPCLISRRSCPAHSRLCKCSLLFASLLLWGFLELGTCWWVLIVSLSPTWASGASHLLTHLLSFTKNPFSLFKHPVPSWPSLLACKLRSNLVKPRAQAPLHSFHLAFCLSSLYPLSLQFLKWVCPSQCHNYIPLLNLSFQLFLLSKKIFPPSQPFLTLTVTPRYLPSLIQMSHDSLILLSLLISLISTS